MIVSDSITWNSYEILKLLFIRKDQKIQLFIQSNIQRKIDWKKFVESVLFSWNRWVIMSQHKLDQWGPAWLSLIRQLLPRACQKSENKGENIMWIWLQWDGIPWELIASSYDQNIPNFWHLLNQIFDRHFFAPIRESRNFL